MRAAIGGIPPEIPISIHILASIPIPISTVARIFIQIYRSDQNGGGSSATKRTTGAGESR